MKRSSPGLLSPCLVLAVLAAGCLDFSSRPVTPGDGGADDGFPDTGDLADDFFPDNPDAVPDQGDPPVDGEWDHAGDCIPNCDTRVCGDDGCGGSCGDCEAPWYCGSRGQCACVPRCGTAACGGPDGCGGECRCILDGSIVEPYPWSSDLEAFRAMLAQMRAFGMSTVIVRAVRLVDCSGSTCSPSTILSDDLVARVLDDAHDMGMEVFLGLVDCRSSVAAVPWWANSSLINNCLNETEDLVGEIAARHGSHPALAGFFLPPTVRFGIDVTSEMTQANSFYRQAAAAVHGEFDGYGVAAMGTYVGSNNGGSEAVSTVELAASVREFAGRGTIPGSDVDILIFRDGAGESKNSLFAAPTFGDYLAAARGAAGSMTLWAGLELYQWSTTMTTAAEDVYFHPASMARIRRQIQQSDGAAARIGVSFPLHMAEGTIILANRSEAESLSRAYRALYFDETYVESASYSYVNDPNPGYGDASGSMLFDDRTGEESRSADWVGWLENSGDPSSILIHLGSERSLTDVTAVFRSETAVNCHYPLSMTVKATADPVAVPEDFTVLGSTPVNFTPETDYGQAVARVSVPSGASALRICVEIIHRAPYVMLSEIEIY
jgi:hypothetical protein